MAKPIKDTPVLYGKHASRFLREVRENAKQDHAAAFARAKTVYERFEGHARGSNHAHAHAG